MADNIAKLGYLAGATRFRRISEKLYSDGDRLYTQFGVEFKASWFSVYYVLMNAEKPLTVQEIANEIGFTHITVKNVLRELEQNGIVMIEGNPSDGRSKHITLAPRGKELLKELSPIWGSIAKALEQLLTSGHPDFINIISRIDKEVERKPLSERVKEIGSYTPVIIADYRPSLEKHFFGLAGNWLIGLLDGRLEEEDEFALRNPGKAYLEKGGFLFFALYGAKPVGCVALKRLTEDSFEFCKLFVDPEARSLGIATKLIERCISRCRENNAKLLALQTTNALKPAHQLYYKLGFIESEAPAGMQVLNRTGKIMVLPL